MVYPNPPKEIAFVVFSTIYQYIHLIQITDMKTKNTVRSH